MTKHILVQDAGNEEPLKKSESIISLLSKIHPDSSDSQRYKRKKSKVKQELITTVGRNATETETETEGEENDDKPKIEKIQDHSNRELIFDSQTKESKQEAHDLSARTRANIDYRTKLWLNEMKLGVGTNPTEETLVT